MDGPAKSCALQVLDFGSAAKATSFANDVGKCTDSIFQHSEYSATWTIKAKTEEGDSMLVDYKLSWQKPSTMSDTTKTDFYISSVSFRRINKENRYLFIKKGKFWEKVIVKNDMVN